MESARACTDVAALRRFAWRDYLSRGLADEWDRTLQEERADITCRASALARDTHRNEYETILAFIKAITTNLACRRAAVCSPASATPCSDYPWHRLTYAQNDAPVKHRHTRARMHARERAQAVPQAAQSEQPGSVGPQQELTFLTSTYL